MEWILSYTPPIPREDLNKIQAQIRNADPFVSGFSPEANDPYDVLTYLQKQMLRGRNSCLLVDRNVITRWIALMAGDSAKPAHRDAAAIFAFAQAATLLIDPSIAIYELTAHAGNQVARDELLRFYRANDVDPVFWANVALGRADRLQVPLLSEERSKLPEDLTGSFYPWQRNYILVLKVAELHLTGGDSQMLMQRLMKWMYDDFLIGGPAVILAAFYFAPGAPRRRLLKSIQSPDREKALAGLRNAAWDLTLISEWIRRIQAWDSGSDHEPVPILCTMDNSVKRIARSIISFDEPSSEILNRLFHEIWGVQPGGQLAASLVEFQMTADNPNRKFHRTTGIDFIPAMIEAGEAIVHGWTPLNANRCGALDRR